MPVDPDSNFLVTKFNDHRLHRRNMWILGGMVGCSLWIWDYIVDAVGAQETWGLRLLFAAVAWTAAVLMDFRSISMRLSQTIGIVAFLICNAIFFFILMRLQGGMVHGIAGFVFLQMGLLVFQGFSMATIIFLHLSVAALPHLLGLSFPNSGFLHAEYAVLMWPAAVATIISHYGLHLEYCRAYSLNKKLEILARTDPLTGALTRRFFDELSGKTLKMAHRYCRPTAVMILDADHFKRVNDTYGHAVGDKVLQMLADVTRKTLRETDLLCRWGGEEFVVLLPESDLSGAINTAERLLGSVRETAVAVEGASPIHVTLSIGISLVRPGEQELAPSIARADEALYRAKSLGRNQMQFDEWELASSASERRLG